MKTNIKNFPRNVDVRGLLRLIWEDLRRISGSVPAAGPEVPDEQDDDFVGILVASGGGKTLYIKSTELADFVEMTPGVHAYDDEECTIPSGVEVPGTWPFDSSGIEDYYEAEGIEDGELPGIEEFDVEDGVITEYYLIDDGEEES